MTAIKDGVTGGVTLKSPIWFKGMECGESYFQTYYYVSGVHGGQPYRKAWLRHAYVYRDFGEYMGDEEDEL
jgi:hypothetical protein